MGYRLGVDLGTTFTAAAVARDGRATIVPLGTDREAMPTVVYVMEDGSSLVGEPATRRALADPTRVAREFKRRIGDPTPILVGGSPWSVDALCAIVLRSVLDSVVEAEGAPPDAVTVTHPANWGAFKRDVLDTAVRDAGMSDARLMTEPEAAGASYANEERVAEGEVIAVYDLGGGTFDATVMRRTATGFEIMGRPDGIERLGGVDFDAAVFGFVAEALGPAFDDLDPTDDDVALSMLETRANCTRAKEALSADTETVINIPLPTGLHQVRLTRVEFEAMIRPPITETITVLERTVAEAGATPEQIDRVLLVGGSSRIPLVAQLIAGTFGRPVAVNAHPKHTVALGAALGLQSPDEATAPPSAGDVAVVAAGADGTGSHRRRRMAVALAAVAIVLLAAAAALAIRARRSHSTLATSPASVTSQSSSSSSSSPAPPPSSASAPPPTSASASSSSPPAVDRCHTADMSALFIDTQGVSGSQFGVFQLLNNGASPCTMNGYPGISLLDNGGNRALPDPQRDSANVVARVTVPPGRFGQFVLQWNAIDDGTGCTTIDQLAITPPDELDAIDIPAVDSVGSRVAPCGDTPVLVRPITGP